MYSGTWGYNGYNNLIAKKTAGLHVFAQPSSVCNENPLLGRLISFLFYDGSYVNVSSVCALLFYDASFFYHKACSEYFVVMK
jgi:hypothetical protein